MIGVLRSRFSGSRFTGQTFAAPWRVQTRQTCGQAESVYTFPYYLQISALPEYSLNSLSNAKFQASFGAINLFFYKGSGKIRR